MYHLHRVTNFKLRAICLAIFSVSMLNAQAQGAAEQAYNDLPTVKLDTVTVNVERKLGRKSTEVTGLGKIIKQTDDINKEQIMGIRDLTRYDPGIAVVEQGRGATSGYSIRGVDRNRVGLQVDGLVQSQSYITEGSDANGGAINEIEYENVRSIELSKGSASAEFGSGALGGAVSFRTKEAKDIISDDKAWGVNTKTAYSSKNRQLANTVALATKTDKFDALVQFTHRKGKQTQVHSAAGDIQQQITKLGAYITPYELRGEPWGQSSDVEVKKGVGWFALKEECPTLKNCQAKPFAEITRYADRRHNPRQAPAYTEKEQADYDKMVHPTETVSAEAYTGSQRILPNPMDYQSKSWLIKGNYHFNDEHSAGVVFENTTQNYDTQDKTKPAYVTLQDLSDFKAGTLAKGVYTGDNIHEGIVLDSLPSRRALMYSFGQFYDEQHNKARRGVLYQYQNAKRNDGVSKLGDLVDDLSISYDHQDINLETFAHQHRCSPYPSFDKNCRADVNKPWSSYYSHRNKYQELHKVLQLSINKHFKFDKTEHRVALLAGVNNFKSNLYRGDYFHESVESGWNRLDNVGAGTYDNPDIYERKPNVLEQTNYCEKNGIGLSDCTTRAITGYNRFFAIRDLIKLGDYVNLGLGVRYDAHQFNSDDRFTAKGNYNNWSYNAGVTVKPTQNISLSYRYSNGYRVPAFYELFGRRKTFDPTNHISVKQQYVSNLSPEKASNQEIGLGVKGEFGYFEISHFKNKYRDLITTAQRRENPNEPPSDDGYYNLQNITLTGINVLAKVDWFRVSEKLPDGLYSTFAYNKIKAKDAQVKSGFVFTNSPLLDTLQPSRYVAGIGYDSPDDRWGVNLTATYSKPKDENELFGQYKGGIEKNIAATKVASKHWYTYDMSGHWNVNNNVTVRAGVYNILNRKYSTWESIRQSSLNAVNQDRGTNATRYAAPGRNFNLALEMKF